MTKVVFEQFGEGTYHITIKGHAGYSKHGEPDIVCSACSVLAYTLAQAFRNMDDDNELYDLSINIDDKTGDVDINAGCRDRETMLVRADAITDTIFDGYKMLEERYPDYVSVEEYFNGKLLG